MPLCLSVPWAELPVGLRRNIRKFLLIATVKLLVWAYRLTFGMGDHDQIGSAAARVRHPALMAYVTGISLRNIFWTNSAHAVF